jgi:putative chitinase
MIDMDKFENALRKLWPHADMRIPGLTAGILASAPALFTHYNLDPLTVANAMGEFTEECNGGMEVEENLNYRAAQLYSQWPIHFTMAQALQMQHNPIAIANQAYNGRMGNKLNSNDGWNYRGRGPAQTTGRSAYELLGTKTGLDLVNHPELINTPANFLNCGLVDFIEICGCLVYAERDDEVNETRHLNGGLIGYAQRHTSIEMWKRFFMGGV